MSLKLLQRIVGDVVVLDLDGRITLGEGSVVLRDTIKELLAQGKRKILLNLSEVNYIDSSGNGELTVALMRVRNQGGVIKILNPTKKIRDLLQITKMYTLWDVRDGEAAALRSFEFSRICECPSCGESTRPECPVRFGPWLEQFCSTCDAQFSVADKDKEQGLLLVTKFRVRTYEGEYFEVVPGPPYMVRIVGRLNLFASAALDKVWRAIPSPRRVIFDFYTATDIDIPGQNALLAFLRRKESIAKVAILVEGLNEVLVAGFGSGSEVCGDRQACLVALGDLSDTPEWLGKFCVRESHT